MAAISDLKFDLNGQPAPCVNWQGRSGRHYLLSLEYRDNFVMREADLYVIARAGRVLWVGSTADLVSDPASRARFRLALEGTSQAFRLDAPADRHAAIWDLEGASPAPLSIGQAA